MNSELKEVVHDYWNEASCGTFASDKEKFTATYYKEIEDHRYAVEPEIFSFAQFSRYRGKKVLEIGVGAGSDFLNWVRSGCEAYGIDLTEEALEHAKNRLQIENLSAQDLRVADCENIPHPDNFFDVVYSWGVIHHTPDTEKALAEIIRICRPGGRVKLMLYHRKSLLAYFFWIKHALLKGKPFRSRADVLYHHMESKGTKAYTEKEVRTMLKPYAVKNLKIAPVLTYYDKMGRFGAFYQSVARFCALLFGYNKVGWFLTIEFDK